MPDDDCHTNNGTGLILGDKKENLAQFSFLMAIPPLLGMALLDVKDMLEVGVEKAMAGITPMALVIGFVAACLRFRTKLFRPFRFDGTQYHLHLWRL